MLFNNYNLILQTTNAIYRYAKIQDKRLPLALREFYQEGIKNPSVAKHLGYLNWGKYILQEGQYLQNPMTIYTYGTHYCFKQLKELLFIPLRIKKIIKTNPELKKLKTIFDAKFSELYSTKNGKKREKIMKTQMEALINKK